MEQSWKSILTTALLVVGMPLMAAAASSAPEGVPSLESPASAMAPIVRRPSAEGPKDMRKGPAVHRSRIRVSPAVAEAMRKETKATLRKGFRLLGKTDAQAAGAFRGGKENYSADGQTLLGRVYNVPVFGEMRQAATIYDRDGKVENVTIQMEGPRTMRYDRILRKLYGNPSYVQPVPGEGGATWQEWDVGVHTVRLYQGYGLPALELRNRPDRREGIPANQVWQPVREAWLPAGVTLTAGSRKPLPALEEALRDYYGLDREAWAKTDYRYNAVDLNGDGTQECFVVVAGPSTSGTGGDSAVWGRMVDGTFRIRQAFTIMRTPVVIETLALAGPGAYRSFLVRRSGGGAAPEIVRYVYRDGRDEAVPAGDIAGVRGRAILCGWSGPRRLQP